jgi:hypothetical protein
MGEVGVRGGAVPVHLVGGDVDHIAGSDIVALVLGCQDPASFDAVKHLRHVVRVQVRARPGAEAHNDDVDTLVATATNRSLQDLESEMLLEQGTDHAFEHEPVVCWR